MADVRLVSVPFHAARRGILMGAGPAALLQGHDLPGALRASGHRVAVEEVDLPEDLVPEIARTFELNRRVARVVEAAVAAGALPLVLAGNCNTCLGVTAGVAHDSLAVIWFDAHADFDTPEDNESGFFDVFGLAILTGAGWRAQRESVRGFEAVPEERVLLVGARDLEPYQRARVEASELGRLSTEEVRAGALDDRLTALRQRAEAVYLHIDLDVLDPSEGTVNRWAAPGGLTADQLIDAAGLIARRFEIRAASLASYDPALDHDGRVGRTAVRLAQTIVRAAARAA